MICFYNIETGELLRTFKNENVDAELCFIQGYVDKPGQGVAVFTSYESDPEDNDDDDCYFYKFFRFDINQDGL
jgi:hypothetical protein